LKFFHLLFIVISDRALVHIPASQLSLRFLRYVREAKEGEGEETFFFLKILFYFINYILFTN
jgi:hypothetical protein